MSSWCVTLTYGPSENAAGVIEKVFGLALDPAAQPPVSPAVFTGTGRESLRDVLVRDYGFKPRPQPYRAAHGAGEGRWRSNA
jgi:hypothetical protein